MWNLLAIGAGEMQLIIILVTLLLRWLAKKDEAEQKKELGELSAEVATKVDALPPDATKKDLVNAVMDGLFGWLKT